MSSKELMEPNIRFGCVFFDDHEDPSDGWCSISGQSPVRIVGVSDLDTDVLWWSNLDYKAIYLDSKLGNVAMIRHDKFLIMSPNDCLKEWGYDPKEYEADWCCNFVSRVFDKIMKMAWKLIVSAIPDIHPKDVFSGKELRVDMSRIFPRPFYPEGEAAAVCKSGYSYIDYTVTTYRPPRGQKFVRLGRNRLSHALDILTTPVPDGKFEFVPGRSIDQKAVFSDTVPWLAEVAVRNIDSDASSVLAFGTTMDKTKRIMRAWIPHPELVTMNDISEIEIRNAWKGEAYTTLAASLPDTVLDFLNDQFSFLSWSAGVLAETIWKSAALGNPKHNPDHGIKPDTSWRGLWIKSIDKSLTFMAAMAMNENSWKVSSYGSGAGQFSCPGTRLPDILRESGSCGLMPRLEIVPENMDVEGYRWDGDPRAKIMAMLTMKKNKSLLWNMDRLPTYPKEQRPDVLKKMQAAARKQS